MDIIDKHPDKLWYYQELSLNHFTLMHQKYLEKVLLLSYENETIESNNNNNTNNKRRKLNIKIQWNNLIKIMCKIILIYN